MSRTKAWLIKIIKWTGKILITMILLLVILIFALRLPFIQSYITGKALGFYTSKVQTRATLGGLYLDFPTTLVVRELYLEGQKQDTLVYLERLSVSANILRLLNNRLQIENVNLSGLTGNIERDPAGTFNFQYIMDAFAGEPSESSSAPMKITVEDVGIADARISYRDRFEGLDVTAKIGDLEISSDVFDLEQSLISIEYLLVQDASAELRLYEAGKPAKLPDSEPAETDTEPFRIDGKFAELQRVKFLMNDEVGGLGLSGEVEDLQVEIDSLDINEQIYLARKINLQKPVVSLEFRNTSTDSIGVVSDSSATDFNLMAGAKVINMNSGRFRLWDHTKEEQTGFDPAHMWYDGLRLQTKEIRFENGNVLAQIEMVAGTDLRNRKQLNSLKGELAYSDSITYARGFDASFDDSQIHADVSLTYPELEELMNFTEKVQFEILLENTRVDPKDILYFLPELSVPKEVLSSPIALSGRVNGSLPEFNIENLTADMGQQHITIPSFEASEILKFPKSEIKASGIDISVTPGILSFFSADSLEQMVDLPSQMSLLADLYFKKDSIRSEAVFTSSYGDFVLAGFGRINQDSIVNFTANLDINQLQLGKILRQPDLGELTLRLKTDGAGNDIPEIEANIDLDLEEFTYREYTYRGMKLNGRLEQESFDGVLNYSDDNLELNYDGLLSLGANDMRQRFSLMVKRADLQALNLSKDEFRLAGNLQADIRVEDDLDVTGEVDLTGLGVNRSGNRYDLDTVRLVAENVSGTRNMTLDSDFIEAFLTASFPIPELPDLVISYYEGLVSDSLPSADLAGKSFDLQVRVKDADVLTEVLVPKLDYLDVSPITVMFDGSEQLMSAEAHLDSVKYGNFMVNRLNIEIEGDKEIVTGSIYWDALRSGPLYMENFFARMQSELDGVKLNIQVRDQVDDLRYNITTRIVRNAERLYELAVHPDSVLLNYSEWYIPESNLVTYGNGVFWISDLELRREQQALMLHSELTSQQDSLLVLSAENFELSELSSLGRDTIPNLSGILHGSVDYNMSTSGFEADVDISDLAVRGFEVGNLNLYSEKSRSDAYHANLQISGKGNEVKFDAAYQTDGLLDADLEIRNLNLDPIEPISSGNLTDVDGVVRGDFTVTGNINQPQINGDLVFENVSFIVDMVKEKFTLNNEELRVTNNVFQFNNFTLQDTQARKATVNGEVSSNDFVEFDLGLNIVTEKFTLLNSKEGDNELFYGKVSATSKLDIRGTNLNPSVNLNLTLSDDSKVTYVIPESTISAQVQSDVVVFVDKDESDTGFLGKKTSRDSLQKSVRGMNLDAVVNVPETAELKIVVDPITGDALTVKGSALLNLGIRPAGDITLTGRYEVKEGSYHMDFYGLVQRDFEIQEGSFILWTGNIYEAILNITAVYKTRARPVLTNNTERLDFVVQLLLMGQLLQPEISFKIDLGEDSPAPIEVQSWIAQMNQDKAQLNKQAFGLLVFNAFFDDTGQSGNWYDNLAQNTARSSVSSFLSSELNRLSDKIEGIELSFDLSSYEDFNSQGENVGRTQLELGLSKQFFDNRLVVKFAGNFDLEGKSAYRNNVSDFTGDLVVEYMLTEDGRYRLVGFRETNYDDLLQGEIIRAGVGFIFVRDYHSLRELFSKSKKQNEEE